MEAIKVPIQLPQHALPRPVDPFDGFLAGQLTDATRRAYRSDLVAFFGGVPMWAEIVAVTVDRVTAYRNRLYAEGRAPATVNRHLSSLRALYRHLVARGLLPANPADAVLVKSFRADEAVSGKAIEDDALRAILAAIEAGADPLLKARDRAIYYVLVLAGLRRSEVARLEWADLRREGPHHVLDLRQTKSGVAQVVKVVPAALAALERYHRALVGAGWPGTGPVFLSLSTNASRGRGLSGAAINAALQRYGEVTAHQFRHTCCTKAIEGGAPPAKVQAHLRHKDIKTTLRYYDNRDNFEDNAADYIDLPG